MAVALKMNFGPFLLVAEYNTALKTAKFIDHAGRRINMAPAAWQVALAYQFDWNPWIEVIGDKGTYVAIGYSRSKDMGGVTLTTTAGPQRVDFVPQSRIMVTAAESVQEGGKVTPRVCA